jgi:hypothetical protein
MIIGLAGYAGAGKDTVGNILIEKHGYRRIAFADKVRGLAYDINPIIDGKQRLQNIVEEIGWDEAKQHPEVRRVLQDTGLAGRNFLGEDIWIWEALGETIFNEGAMGNPMEEKEQGSIKENIVITDVRFENEARFIKDFGGVVWQIVREGVSPVNDHISETDLIGFNFDKTLTNNGDLENLEAQIDV